jgi:hypothetical protein
MEIGKRTRISDNQRDISERFYGRGMVGVGLNYREMIETAVSSNNDSSYNAPINVMPDPREGGQTQGHLTFSIFLCQ